MKTEQVIIQNYVNNIIKKFDYNGSVIVKIGNNFILEHGDMYPFFSNEHENILYIDQDAYKDLANNSEAMEFYLPHEIAHIIADEGHNGEKFKKLIREYNNKYNANVLANPSNEDYYNAKYLPTYFKKEQYIYNINNCKNNKEIIKAIENRTWEKATK